MLSRTARYYKKNPEARKRRLAQQKRYDNGQGSTGRSKEEINNYKKSLQRWKRKNRKNKPKGRVVEAVHGKNGQIRWAVGEAARRHNRGNEVRKRNKPSNPKGGNLKKQRRKRVKLSSMK